MAAKGFIIYEDWEVYTNKPFKHICWVVKEDNKTFDKADIDRVVEASKGIDPTKLVWKMRERRIQRI